MIKTRTNNERENVQRSKRLRKKLHVAEFKQYCVNIYFDCSVVDKNIDIIDYILEIAYGNGIVIGTISNDYDGFACVIMELEVGYEYINGDDDAKIMLIEEGIISIGGKYLDSHLYDAWYLDELLYDEVEKNVHDTFNMSSNNPCNPNG